MDLNSALYLIHFYHKKRKKKKEIAQQQGTKNETIIKILFKKMISFFPMSQQL